MELLNKINWYRINATFQAKNTVNTYVCSIIEAVTKEISRLSHYDAEIIFHILDHPFSLKLKEGEKYIVSIILTKDDLKTANNFFYMMIDYFKDSWNSRNLELVSVDSPLPRNYSLIKAETDEDLIKREEICLDFLTPLPFKPKHSKKRAHIQKDDFINLISKRFERIFNISPTIDSKEIEILPYWRYEEYLVNSASQKGSSRYINGCIGKVYLKGNLSIIMPYILVCQELHMGSSISYSRGYFQIQPKTKSSFIKPSILEELLSFYLSKNKENFADRTQEELLRDFYREVATASYEPAPSEAFYNEETRNLVGKLYWKDMVVHSVLYKLLKNPIDNILPLTVFSFRPHFSEKDVKDKIDELLNSGYNKVAIFSLESFYGEIDHKKLIQTLTELIPNSDQFIIKLIEKILKAGYIYENTHYTSEKGLPLGSPLSPMLSNIYLYKVDKSLNSENTVTLRHADTFLIMSQTEEALTETLEKAEKLLKDLGLKINKKSIKNLVNEEIIFAGVKIEKREKIDRLRKPLYIINSKAHLSLQGETIKISDPDGNFETIPLSRLSEIIIATDTTLTTPVLKKLTSYNIPVILTSHFESPLVLIRRDYKAHYMGVFKHTAKYSTLTEDEILSFAKDIATKKIKSYEMFFTLKRHPLHTQINDKLRLIRQRILEAKTLDTIRGFEAQASKELYKSLNILIKNKDFHIKSRRRQNPDMINSLINLCSHILFNKIRTVIHAYSLNPYLGFLHSPENSYESLCADIHELLRARIDSFIVNIINLRVIDRDDFKEVENSMILKSQSLNKLIEKLENYLCEVYGSEDNTLYDFIIKHAQIIKDWVWKDKELYFEIPW
ncbi:MAG: CRISPR-associated endonuclease Cas1 [Thermodesulfovibrio sp.]|nr:CRISPR-associated endonuclease Cas1 [Thermodesulfovibrio sp.]